MAAKPEEKPAIPKKKRRINPLKTKSKKPEVIKTLDEINKPSKGEELLQTIIESEKNYEQPVELHTAEIVEPAEEVAVEPEPADPKKESTSEGLLIPKPINYTSMIKDGVEVVDVKAILEDKKKQIEK